MLKLLFWILVLIIFYAYAGYSLLLMLFNLFKKKNINPEINSNDLPEVTLLIASYNEKDILKEKIENSNNLIYPKSKLHHLWITDGSTDGSDNLLRNTPGMIVLHLPERNGKTAAINRAMQSVKTPFTVLCDANSMLSPNAIKKLMESFCDDGIGCVAGEKRISTQKKDKASAAGEGFYWNYESFIKKLESSFGSTLGAAGELYAIRTELYTPPANNIILDDFVVSLNIAEKGFKIKYQPEAYATEDSSFNISEEMKRKIRIAAGSFQVLFGRPSLLNFFRHFKLSFQYLSHKAIRWLFVPFAIPLAFLFNLIIVIHFKNIDLYFYLLATQVLFYLLVIAGSALKDKITRIKILFYPFYLVMMNYCIILGLWRYLTKNQDAAWEKVKRRN